MSVLMKAKEAADQAYEAIKTKVEAMGKNGLHPHMAVLLVEGDPASAYYAQSKQRIASKLGVAFHLHAFPANVTEDEILRLITQLNDDPTVHGIMLELPLPKHLSANKIEQAISPMKDIDGVTPSNKLATVTGGAGLYPATPQACIKLLNHYGYRLEGKNVTLIGRGQTVGMPLFHMLQRENATVTVCHSRTPDLALHLSHAEIAFVAVGRPDAVDRSMVHPNLAIIDAGINETADGKIVGDVATDAGNHACAISPVPGGVGTLTTAILFENLMKAIGMQFGEELR
ncbi:bifunctional 5,10-methylenetetrahydrofolate dehydrogenase/5,10-methenyltetrahydrofolate cyclohydrolase [Paenibacillus sp. MMS18-CY102]|uniref:bifunctional 5,10-methylenetetrahydrofolate dehydrogenase/5,10-methenyltetrahydrofolate cyclohydrolase n=1 Tax=Paenibacillus sp. MMS18-CY102 TaxID=2682849 RepID=UPI0013654404|nr:bifunctional 5,10-methylenetetrahydrofolate dehydrogenase/5,10-methenyltetrahydrofolate cyclohydrolase [Paenibacillus sp. MMS18-CY102]MWC27667.1 bifunctional 5,10-methylene-tetrahydrofolate dehydrogenase/5,10-methylene-tetrahydrofolate cyclohydrolase [Paenibacillus sp. MMS18-CY102]